MFPKKIRLRLIWEKLVAASEVGGADVPVEKLILDKNHPLVAVFPLHTQCHRSWLDKNWLKRWDWEALVHPPLDDIRDYFNEPIAFYFSFMQYYIKWLIPLSFFGILWSGLVLSAKQSTFGLVEFFIVFVIVWSVCFVDFWKRRQNYLAMKWGMHHFHEKEIRRPSFRGHWYIDEMTGEPIESFPREWKFVRIFGGFTGVFLLISIVVAVTTLMFTLKNFLRTSKGVPECWLMTEKYPKCTEYACVDGTKQADCSDNEGPAKVLPLWLLLCVGIINAITISILNAIFTFVSMTLNE